MRERLDCAILCFGDMADRYKQKEGVYARGRLHLHRLQQPDSPADDIHVLADMAASLQRFDVCLIPICEENLGWIRRAMLVACPQLRTPVIGLVRNLKAAAIGDLYNLGMADFVREPLCVEEVRIRTERLLDLPHLLQTTPYARSASVTPCAVHDGNKGYVQRSAGGSIAGHRASVNLLTDGSDMVSDSPLIGQPGDIELEAFAIASAAHGAGSSESFGVAKSKVVGCFERAYLHASLAKSSGNIALAARGAKKHRRAYWALMRKHNIDAAPYRKIAPPNQ